jgi:hypothetical protein
MFGAIEFAGSTKNCLIRNMSISGAAFDVTDPLDVAGRRAYADRANDEKGRPAFTLNQGVDQGGAPVFGLPPSQSAF